jgi:hypothetical protein
MKPKTVTETLKAAHAKAKREALELAFRQQILAMKLGAGMVQQWMPFEDVGYAFDFAWPDRNPIILVEVQGGIWSGGAHVRPKGVLRDIDKHNRAAMAGYLLLYVTAESISNGTAVAMVEDIMGL